MTEANIETIRTPLEVLCEQVNGDLAQFQTEYADWLRLPFTQRIMQHALEQTQRAGQNVIATLNPKEQAEYLALEKIANGTYFRDAFHAGLARIKAPFFAAQNAATLEAQGARAASLGDSFPGNGAPA